MWRLRPVCKMRCVLTCVASAVPPAPHRFLRAGADTTKCIDQAWVDLASTGQPANGYLSSPAGAQAASEVFAALLQGSIDAAGATAAEV